MKPEELISDRRLQDILGKIYDEHCHVGQYSTPGMMLLAARAALEELEIVDIRNVKMDIHHWNERVFVSIKLLEKGAVLVRAKEKA